jgi:CheY-like chemotaxis protein
MASTAPPPEILFVDDSDDDFFLIQRLLEKTGLKNPVTRFSNGHDAIAYLLEKSATGGPAPCLVFLDVKMPGWNGFEMLSWIKHHRSFQRAKVFMLSGGCLQADIQRAASLGADGFLKKFPPVEEFQKLIGDVDPTGPR